MGKKPTAKWLLFCIVLVSRYSLALGTAAGTVVTNQARVSFNAEDIAQDEVVSNASSFVVDRVINLNFVRNDASYVTGVPNEANIIATFTLTNLGNGTQDFNFGIAQQNAGTSDVFGGTDTINLQNNSIRVDVNGDGVYIASDDNKAYVDELAPDDSILVFVRGRLPAASVDGDIASIRVLARTRNGGLPGSLGTNVSQSGGADNEATEEIVFADGTGIGSGDSDNDARFAAMTAYKVVSANLSVTKISSVISDPINGTVFAKRIPGALIEYTVTVDNSGSADADELVVLDYVPPNTTYVPESLVVDGVSEDDDDNGSDESDPYGASFTSGTQEIKASIPSLGIGENKSLRFRATID